MHGRQMRLGIPRYTDVRFCAYAARHAATSARRCSGCMASAAVHLVDRVTFEKVDCLSVPAAGEAGLAAPGQGVASGSAWPRGARWRDGAIAGAPDF